MIIALVSPISDVGKTTLVTHWGDGSRVTGGAMILMDADPHEGALRGSRQRCATIYPSRFHAPSTPRHWVCEGTQGKQRAEAYVHIDVSSTPSPITQLVLMFAVPVLVWLRPACFQQAADLTAVRMLLDVCHCRSRRPGALVINRCMEGRLVDQRISRALANQALLLLASASHRRRIFAHSAVTGQLVRELVTRGPSAQEVVHLAEEGRGVAR